MMEILRAIETQLGTVSRLQYVDEDWGQLDDYSSAPPVKWPCALIDLNAAQFSNIGTDKQASPMERQEATANISITFAKAKFTNTSLKAPVRQKKEGWEMLDVIELAHEVLQGFHPTEKCGAMIRTSFTRIRRDDGIQQYRVIYSMGMHNV